MTSSRKSEIRISKSETSEQPVVKSDFKVQLQNFFKLLFSFVLVGGDLA